jgi:hypothetical protein
VRSIGSIRKTAVTAILSAAALVLSTLVATPARAADPIYDPIRAMPSQSRLGLVLQEYASFPQSFPTPAPTDVRLVRTARINTIVRQHRPAA